MAWESNTQDDCTFEHQNDGDSVVGSKPEVKALYSTSDPIRRLTQAIEVQSPRLKQVLEVVLRNYPEVAIRPKEAAKFKTPFKPFFHSWQQLLKRHDDEEDERIKLELSLLIATLKPTLDPLFIIANDMHRTGEINFDNLWTVYPPGDLMVIRYGDAVRIFRLHDMDLSITYGMQPNYWTLTLQQIEWNGRYFGVLQRRARVSEAEYPMLFEKLPVLPLSTQRDRDAIERKFLARGNRYLELCSHKCLMKTYKGTKYVLNSEMEAIREKPLSGRIVIDPFAFFTCQSDIAPKQPRLNGKDSDAFFSGDQDLFGTESDLKEEDENEESEIAKITGLEKRLLCLVDRIKGFDLRNNEWCEFDVDNISDAVYNDDALQQLVLSEGEKKLLVAFTQRNELEIPDFDDFIQDKGKGIITLLAGPPGVGKTLTAESISERSRVPLYSLRASDLGTDSSHVESTLKDALECCKLWNAVLLIDEADVFMNTRSADRLEQNELISIFLRNLEYYQGVMFLTTNRLDCIDPAFRSRIDLILAYPALDHAARRHIWATFVSSLPRASCSIGEPELDDLAREQLNGRDIKNVVKVARFLAAAEERALGMGHLRTVLDIKRKAG